MPLESCDERGILGGARPLGESAPVVLYGSWLLVADVVILHSGAGGTGIHVLRLGERICHPRREDVLMRMKAIRLEVRTVQTSKRTVATSVATVQTCRRIVATSVRTVQTSVRRVQTCRRSVQTARRTVATQVWKARLAVRIVATLVRTVQTSRRIIASSVRTAQTCRRAVQTSRRIVLTCRRIVLGCLRLFCQGPCGGGPRLSIMGSWLARMLPCQSRNSMWYVKFGYFSGSG